MRRARKIYLFLNKKISRLALAFAAGINIFFENKSGNQSERQRSLREKRLVRPAASRALAARCARICFVRPAASPCPAPHWFVRSSGAFYLQRKGRLLILQLFHHGASTLALKKQVHFPRGLKSQQ